jgi:LysR family hydrogen peroxide-inducible transcriptional activator
MVDNGLGVTFMPGMAIDAGILANTDVDALPLSSAHSHRSIALIWRRSSARENEFRMLAAALQQIMSDLRPAAKSALRAAG